MVDLFQRYRSFIPDFEGFLDAIQGPLQVEFRINALRADPKLVEDSLKRRGIGFYPLVEGVAYRLQGVGIGNFVEYKMGYIYPQALTSVIAGMVLSPKPDSFVLDMCAAPGSKTTHMAQLMGNKGLIVANELYPDRLPALGQNLYRLGVTNTIITSYQAQEFPRANQFDFIMADVPCSSEGRFRIRKQKPVFRNWKEERLRTIQKRILLNGYGLLRRGGVMLYSTCTYSPEENECIVDYLLKNSDAELLEIDPLIPSEDGLLTWEGDGFHPSMRYCKRFYPHQMGSVGFFMAKIRRP